jgi:hypothetical protein
MTMNRRLVYFRQLFAFTVERYDVLADRWERYGSVLLPDNAYRDELAHALLVLGLRMPRGTDRVMWDYDTRGWEPGRTELTLPKPRARINNAEGRPLVRLSAREKKNVVELGRKKL